MSGGIILSSPFRQREAKLHEAAGLVAYTQPFNTTRAVGTITSGKAYATGVWLPAGLTLTTLYAWVDSAAGTVTTARFGVWNAALALVASSTNDTALFASTGFRSKALTSAYTTPSDGVYYLGLISTATTPGNFALGEAGNTTSVPSLNGVYFSMAQTGASDLPDPFVPGSGNAPFALWIGAA